MCLVSLTGVGIYDSFSYADSNVHLMCIICVWYFECKHHPCRQLTAAFFTILLLWQALAKQPVKLHLDNIEAELKAKFSNAKKAKSSNAKNVTLLSLHVDAERLPYGAAMWREDMLPSDLTPLEMAVGLGTHHDGMTGTCKQHVSDDYTLRLATSCVQL
jgi:hypothetical protein